MARNRTKEESLLTRVQELEELVEALRMSRAAFDQLGQTAVQINIQLEVAEALQQRDPDRSKQSLKQARALATALLDDIRQILACVAAEGLLA